MNALPTTCPDFVSHPHLVETVSRWKDKDGNITETKSMRGCYRCQEALASEEQGTTQIARALRDLGIEADINQTGGFTMCVYVSTGGDSYMYANDEGFSFYLNEDCDGWANYTFHESENTPEKKAEAIRQSLALVLTK